jgi:hypothetical protein
LGFICKWIVGTTPGQQYIRPWRQSIDTICDAKRLGSAHELKAYMALVQLDALKCKAL